MCYKIDTCYIKILLLFSFLLLISGCLISKLDEPTKQHIINLNNQIDFTVKNIQRELNRYNGLLKNTDDKNNLIIYQNINSTIQDVEKRLKNINSNDSKLPKLAQKLLSEKRDSYINYFEHLAIINSIFINNNGSMNIIKSDLDTINQLKFYSGVYIRKCKDADLNLKNYLKHENVVIPFDFNDIIRINDVMYKIEYSKWTDTLSSNKLLNQKPENHYLYVKLKAKNLENKDILLPKFALIDDKGKIHKIIKDSWYSKEAFNPQTYLSSKKEEEGYLVFDVPKNRYYRLLIYNKSPEIVCYVYVNPKPVIYLERKN